MTPSLKIYIIHYSRLKERKKNIQLLLDPLPIDYEFIETYDRDDLENVDVTMFYEDNEKIFSEKVKLWGEKANEHSTMSESELSCSIKHIEALNKISHGNAEFNLILEDDVIPKYTNFLEQITSFLEKPSEWDVLFIGEGMGENYRKTKIGLRRFNPLKKTFKMPHPATNCLEAYVVKKSSVITILDELTPINLVIDWELAYQFYKKKMNIYWSKKSIFIQGSKNNTYKSELR